jgi:hypothetical protein
LTAQQAEDSTFAGMYVCLEGKLLVARSYLPEPIRQTDAVVTASSAVAHWASPGSMKSAYACPGPRRLMQVAGASPEVNKEANAALTLRVCYLA